MAKKSHSSKPIPKEDKSYLKYYSLGLELVVLNLALIMGGYFLDDYLRTSPVIILIGTFAAMAGTILILMKRLK